MSSLDRIAEERTDLSAEEIDGLRSLVGAWSLVADLAMSDLVLWLPTWNSAGWVAAALVRPATAPTSLAQDIVGSFEPRGRRPELDRAVATGGIVGSPPQSAAEIEAIPVHVAGRIAAVLARHPITRVGGRLEEVYLEITEILLGMVAEGKFPPPGFHAADGGTPPRVGDGLIRLSERGRVEFASPNALSAFHRLGLATAIEGAELAPTAVRLVHRTGPMDEALALVAGGRAAGDAEVENASASVTLRCVPLLTRGNPVGAIVLVRDVTDLRRGERALLSKEATLREVHHRVKNNLQTVGALLRLQSRRVEAAEAKEALAEAGRRVSAIAAVHEILSQEPGDTIDFDAVIDRLVHLARDLAPAHAEARPTPGIERVGSIGAVDTDIASPLAMAVSELLQNALEHAGATSITVDTHRTEESIVVDVRDDGCGIGDAEPGLGLTIVAMLIDEDVHGRLDVADQSSGGTHARIEVPRAHRAGDRR